MCCQYYFADETRRELEDLTGEKLPQDYLGDIHPTDTAWVLTDSDRHLKALPMRFGFTGRDQNQLMINARAESALQKPSFSRSVLERRCIIPARHFYEWDAQKNKCTFTWDESPTLYMAGFYNLIDGQYRFIILTTAANASMRSVHDRMPLILPKPRILDWIYDDRRVQNYLKADSPMLTKTQEYEQLTLF